METEPTMDDSILAMIDDIEQTYQNNEMSNQEDDRNNKH